MSQKIQVRRGTDAARQTVIFDAGEPAFATDTRKLYIGDGSSLGGVAITADSSSNSETHTIINSSSGVTAAQNGVLLANAIVDAGGKNPYNIPRSATNNYSIFLYPGQYSLTGIVNIPRYVSIIGVGDANNIIVYADTPEAYYPFDVLSGHVHFENLYLNQRGQIDPPYFINIGGVDTTGIVLKDIIYSGLDNSTQSLLGLSSLKNIVNMTLDNIVSAPNNGGLLFPDDIGTYQDTNFKNATLKNINFMGATNLFQGGYNIVTHNLTVANSSFIMTRTFTDMFGSSGVNGIINNCIFSGAPFGAGACSFAQDTNNLRHHNLLVKDCVFIDLNTSFSRAITYENCSFRQTRQLDDNFLILHSGRAYPVFYNCNFISSYPNQTMVTGYRFTYVGFTGNRETSGLFINCRFNTTPWTGATGAFGPQDSKFDVRYR